MSAKNKAVAIPFDETIISSIVINGDLSKLNPTQKVAYYRQFCERLGLDPTGERVEWAEYQIFPDVEPAPQYRARATFDANGAVQKVRLLGNWPRGHYYSALNDAEARICEIFHLNGRGEPIAAL